MADLTKFEAAVAMIDDLDLLRKMADTVIARVKAVRKQRDREACRTLRAGDRVSWEGDGDHYVGVVHKTARTRVTVEVTNAEPGAKRNVGDWIRLPGNWLTLEDDQK